MSELKFYDAMRRVEENPLTGTFSSDALVDMLVCVLGYVFPLLHSLVHGFIIH